LRSTEEKAKGSKLGREKKGLSLLLKAELLLLNSRRKFIGQISSIRVKEAGGGVTGGDRRLPTEEDKKGGNIFP